MSRPVSIQRDVILSAALKIFLRHGLKGTTAQVAKAAGVSEGSIFKHFKTKNQLFIMALHTEAKEMPWHKTLAESIGKGNISKLLETAGREMLARLQIVIPRMVMLSSGGMLMDNRWCFKDEPPPLHNLRILAKYLQAETKLGRLAVKDPKSQAHAFVGALAHYVFCETLLGYRPATPNAYVRAVVGMVLGTSVPTATRKSWRK